MENQTNNTKGNNQTPAFGIALFLGIVVFIFFLNQLPFPEDYGFFSLAGIFVASCFVGGLIFAAAAGIITAVYKVIIEIVTVLLLFFNVCYVAYCWAEFDRVIFDLGWSGQNTFISILLLALSLLVINLVAVIILLPFARIAKSDVFDV